MDPILGQITYFPWSWVMVGWLPCRGQILPISQYSALFALLGTNYGGDGRSTFALPDLRPLATDPTYNVRSPSVTVLHDAEDATKVIGGVLADTTVTYHPAPTDAGHRREWTYGEIVPHIAIQGIFPSRD